MKTITLIPHSDKEVVTNINGNLVIPNVTNYKVGYKLIWIEYNNGESIIAVKRADFSDMIIREQTRVIIDGAGFERINCDTHDYNDF